MTRKRSSRSISIGMPRIRLPMSLNFGRDRQHAVEIGPRVDVIEDVEFAHGASLQWAPDRWRPPSRPTRSRCPAPSSWVPGASFLKFRRDPLKFFTDTQRDLRRHREVHLRPAADFSRQPSRLDRRRPRHVGEEVPERRRAAARQAPARRRPADRRKARRTCASAAPSSRSSIASRCSASPMRW